MSRNLARRGGSSYNPNSNKAARQEKKNNKKQLFDIGSDSDNASQKCSRIITKDSIDEDYEDFIADALADGGLVGSTSTAIPQQNNSHSTSQENTQASTPNNSAAPTAPGQDASSGANASIHAPRNKENISSPNASPNMDINDSTSPDQAVDPSPTITINRAKMQQARIVYDHADAISRFTTQWAVYCFSTCLRVTPCHYSVDQKAARREFVAVLSGLPANTKDIHLAPLVKEHGAKAINIPLSLNSYKPKPWAYVTFNSQATMDAAMEQTIGFQGRTLRWGTSNDSKALCHRCGKLGCAPTSCPLNQRRGRSRTRDPVAALKERFNIGQRPAQQRTSRNDSRSRSRSKSRDRSASAQRSNLHSNSFNNNNNNKNNNLHNDHVNPTSSVPAGSSSSAHG
ncbi:hypothetical protein RhiirC2_797274, partial [Rhizophagus irregularis]